jgi:hypothetical protein
MSRFSAVDVFTAVGFLIGAAITVIALANCAAFQKTVDNIGDVTACVLLHDRETPAQIAQECAGAAVEDIVKILSAHKEAQKRAAQRGECGE